MTLTSGTRLGPYEIQAAIGAGGMGEVYKAKDTRLDRSVAIKVLPPAFSGDPDRRARFEREAKTIAGLNHPHICTLHDVGEHDGSTYLVMEHLQGQTLADRLAKGPLPLEQALTVTTEIADALTAAHRQGVIHRDLKPGNVMLTKAGAKLLDFGLAKLKGHGEQAAAASLASAPTQTRPLTSEGAIVGTLQYMAPEQVEGKPADARTDLWALGTILYEMLTGKRAFAGDTAASLIGNIMNAEPAAMGTLQPLTPPAIDRLVRQCLAKAPEDRPDTAHDVANELRWMRESSGAGAMTGGQPRRHRGVRALLVVACVAVVAAAGGAGLTWLWRPPTAGPAAEVEINVRPAEELSTRLSVERGFLYGPPGGSRTAFAWTPDGAALAFIGWTGGVRRIYVRRLDREEPTRELTGTDGAITLAVSPNGRSVAFIASRYERTRTSTPVVKTIPIDGGSLIDVCTVTGIPPDRVAWRTNDEIVYSNGRLWKVAATANSQPTDIIPFDLARQRELVSVLPGGDVILFDERRFEGKLPATNVMALRLSNRKTTTVVEGAADARYVPPGYLLYFRAKGQLSAVAFDPEALTPLGKSEVMMDGVSQATGGRSSIERTLAGQFAIAPVTGHLAYLRAYSEREIPPSSQTRLIRVDRQGRGSSLPYGPDDGTVMPARFVPGHLGAVSWISMQSLFRFERGRASSLVPQWVWYAWSRDGRRLATLEDNRLTLRKADGSDPHTVPDGDGMTPSSWSHGDQHLLCTRESDWNIYTLTLDGMKWDKVARHENAISAQHPEVSPTGRWLAYTEGYTGREDTVWVQPFPRSGQLRQVSGLGGAGPAWSPRGNELFYLDKNRPDDADPNRTRYMMEVDVTETADGIEFGEPQRLFDTLKVKVDGTPLTTWWAGSPTRMFDVAPDGESFLALQGERPLAPPVTHITVIPNWVDKVKAKVKSGR